MRAMLRRRTSTKEPEEAHAMQSKKEDHEEKSQNDATVDVNHAGTER
jgi:hypothetical protein